MTPEEREELLAAYALGTLSAPDASDVEALVASDDAAAADLAAYRELVDLIALSVPLGRADPALRDRVLAAAKREGRGRRVYHPRMKRLLPVAALAAALLVVSLWAMSLRSSLHELQHESATLTALVESNAKRLDALDGSTNVAPGSQSLSLQFANALQEQQVIAAVQTDPAVQTMNLQPTVYGHGAGGRYLWSAAAGAAVVVAHDLPQLPFGDVYRVSLEDSSRTTIATTSFVPDSLGNAQVVLHTQGDRSPSRVAVGVASSGNAQNIDGPIVLQAISGSQP
jgi:ABC-type uncharacterized transport system YnjBCD permease subunit